MALSMLQAPAQRTVAPRGGLRVLAVARPSKSVSVSKANDATQMQVFKMAALSAVAGNMMMAGHAEAAQQVAELAGGDNRVSVLLALFLPVIGWVGFNILGPLLNQVDNMSTINKSVVIGTGLGLATLLAAGNADAAQQVAELAGSDNRVSVLLALFLPVVGWVGFNILGPLLNQVDNMSNKSVAVGAGLGLATLLAAGNADAAQQVAELAASDNRLSVLLTLFLPVIGWVGFNILGPLLNQVDNMSTSNKSVAIGAGLGLATLLAAGNADAAQQVAELAGSDNRLSVLLALFLPVVGWVGFNILGPLLNQVDNMSNKSVAVGAGLGLATLLAAGNADAAQQVAELAGSDNRLSVLLALFLPVVGWVGFNILGPLLNQVDSMKK